MMITKKRFKELLKEEIERDAGIDNLLKSEEVTFEINDDKVDPKYADQLLSNFQNLSLDDFAAKWQAVATIEDPANAKVRQWTVYNTKDGGEFVVEVVYSQENKAGDSQQWVERDSPQVKQLQQLLNK